MALATRPDALCPDPAAPVLPHPRHPPAGRGRTGSFPTQTTPRHRALPEPAGSRLSSSCHTKRRDFRVVNNRIAEARAPGADYVVACSSAALPFGRRYRCEIDRLGEFGNSRA